MRVLFRFFSTASLCICFFAGATCAFAAAPLELQNRTPESQKPAPHMPEPGTIPKPAPEPAPQPAPLGPPPVLVLPTQPVQPAQPAQPTQPQVIIPQTPSPQSPVAPTIIVPVVPVPATPAEPHVTPAQKIPDISVPVVPVTPDPKTPKEPELAKPEPEKKKEETKPLTPGSFLPKAKEPEKKEEKKPETKPVPKPEKKDEKKPEAKPEKKIPPKEPGKPEKGEPLKIPDEAKQTGSLDFLEGCWVGTRPEYHTKRMVTERFCFDESGVGKRFIIDPAYAGQCVGATKALLNQGGTLRMQSEQMYCSNNGEIWGASEMTCQGEGEKTPCTWIFTDISGATQSYSIQFVRE